MDKRNTGWLAVVLVLMAVVLAGAGFIWSRQAPAGAVEVRTVTPHYSLGDVYIGGAVVAPGRYPLKPGDTFEDLIAAAGGLLPGANADDISLSIGPAAGPQRVNINTAGAWLLAALPGIGETKAGAIVAYRETNGPFRATAEIMDVPGIGEGLYEDIRDLIEVGE